MKKPSLSPTVAVLCFITGFIPGYFLMDHFVWAQDPLPAVSESQPLKIVWAQGPLPVVYHIEAMQEDGSLSAVIDTLVCRGLICSARGHIWAGGCGKPGCLVFHPNPMRHCLLCGKVEMRSLGPWQ